MPFYYSVAPTADVTTSASANTLVDHLRGASATNIMAGVCGLYLSGKGAAQTSITGIQAILRRHNPASTVGASITPAPRDVRALPTATSTWFTAPTVGTAAAVQLAIGCMSSGVGQWVAFNEDHAIALDAGGGATNGNVDLLSETEGTVALNFRYTLELYER